MNQSTQPIQPNIPQKPPQPQPSFQPEMPKKSSLPIWAIVLIVVAGIIVIGLVGYFAYRYFAPGPEPAELPEGGEEITPGLLPTGEPTEEPADETADWQTYRNEEYGFEVTLTDAWEGYRVIERIEEDERYPNESIVTFCFQMPKSDNKWLLLFDLIGFSKSEWERRQNEGPPTPTLVAENDFYAFGYRITPHDLPPEEMDLLKKEKDILEIYKVISTFKFIE